MDNKAQVSLKSKPNDFVRPINITALLISQHYGLHSRRSFHDQVESVDFYSCMKEIDQYYTFLCSCQRNQSVLASVLTG